MSGLNLVVLLLVRLMVRFGYIMVSRLSLALLLVRDCLRATAQLMSPPVASNRTLTSFKAPLLER